MNCQSLKDNLDDFVDGHLDAGISAGLTVHVDNCDACARQVHAARDLKDRLTAYRQSGVALPDDAFFANAINRAAVTGSRKARRKYWLRGFGSAIAASLALFAATLLFLREPVETGPQVMMTLEQPQTVNLVFASATELVDATLTVALPQGVSLAGFEGQQEVSWVTSLKEGKNILPLSLIATTSTGGELLATLVHEDDDRTFRVTVSVI